MSRLGPTAARPCGSKGLRARHCCAAWRWPGPWALARSLLLGVGLAAFAAVAAAPLAVRAEGAAFFPLEGVRPGLRGYGLTVVEGTRIERFDVEILGLVRGAGLVGDLVLVRVSGPAVSPFGGIAAGMSGSPVYVDGQLLGAVGFSFEFSDHSIGFVTPIQDMVRVLELLGPPSAQGAPPTSQDTRVRRDPEEAAGPGFAAGPGPAEPTAQAAPPFQRVALAPNEEVARQLKAQSPPGTAVMVPVATPVMVGGLGPRTQRLVQQWLSRYGVMWVPAAGTLAGSEALPSEPPPLQPGSALAVSLARGDVELTAIGTVTYVEGDRYVAFGHPFLQKGSVDFFAAPAYIFRTVSRISVPFKIGAAYPPTGVLAEDRRAGVAGRIGVKPRPVRVQVAVQDLSSARQRSLQVEVVRDDTLTVPLIAIAALEALDRGLDRIGPGTARVIYRIRGARLSASGTYSRDNVYYSRLDISARLLGDFLDTLQALAYNRFRDIELTDVQLTVQVEQARRTATIVRARALQERVQPGGSVGIEVELQPYRGSPETRVLTLQIPENVAPGTVTVTVRGGSQQAVSLAPDLEGLFGGETPKPPQDEEVEPLEGFQEPATSLEKLLEALDEREKNNQVVAEFYPGIADRPRVSSPPASGQSDPPGRVPGRTPGSASGKSQNRSEGLRPGESVKALLTTPWVIEGSADVELTIEEPGQAPASEPGP